MTAKELFLETIKQDGNPERLLKQYEGLTFYPPNPASTYIRGARQRGMEPMKDRFGTEILWPADQITAMPHVTESNKVISDICEWKEQLKMPELLENCSDPALWAPFKEKAREIKESGKLFMSFMPTGVFEINALFLGLLRGLGYTAFPTACRVLMRPGLSAFIRFYIGRE